VSRWTRTLRFSPNNALWSRTVAYVECASTITSHSRALVELALGASFYLSTEKVVAAAVEAAVGTLHRLELSFAEGTSPALWAAAGTVVHLRSLHLYADSEELFTEWEGLGSWELPHLRRLALDLNNYEFSEDYDGIFTFLGRCSFPAFQELEISTLELMFLQDVPAVGRFLSSHPAIIHLTVHGRPNLLNDIMEHALAETVTLSRFPDAPAVARISPRIHTLNIITKTPDEDEERLFPFLKALTNDRPRCVKLACIKLDFRLGLQDRLRSWILPFAQRLHEQSITLLDAHDERYYV
jgi:hypothetical protein